MNGSTPEVDSDQAVAVAFREEWTRVLATLIAQTGDWDLAEESTQDAFTQAIATWRRDGVPDRPRAWLTTTARNRAIDRIRRDRVGTEKLRLLRNSTTEPSASGAAGDAPIGDDRLRLLFTCCHPALALDAQVALALRTLCGLSVAEIARAFLVGQAAMAKRLVRTKRKIAVAGIPYRVPPPHLLPERLDGVLGTIYLLFNEGYAATSGPDLLRRDLTGHAIRLGRLVSELLPDEPEAAGLSALLRIHEARADARIGPDGSLIPLEEQDRSKWDSHAIESAVTSLREAVSRGRIGPYQLQALIAASHATAPSSAATNWCRIVSLYDELVRLAPSVTVRLNRAVAVGMRDGPPAGLRELNELNDADHPLVGAARADLLRRAGRLHAAASAYRAAIDRSGNEVERAYLQRRLAECEADEWRPDSTADGTA